MAKGGGFDPDRVAYYEAHGWRAYYDRDWPKLLRLMIGMNQDQLRELNKLLCEYRERHIGWETKDKLMLTSINLVQQHVSISLELSRETTTVK